MKSLILILLITFFIHPAIDADESEKSKKDETVKVRITEEETELPDTESTKAQLPEVEIEVLEEVNIVTTDATLVSAEPDTSVQDISESKFTPTQPDNNLMIYFILLMVIVVGIMALASIIPGPSSTRSDK